MSNKVNGYIEVELGNPHSVFAYHSSAETTEKLIDKLIKCVSHKINDVDQIKFIKIFEGVKNVE